MSKSFVCSKLAILCCVFFIATNATAFMDSDRVTQMTLFETSVDDWGRLSNPFDHLGINRHHGPGWLGDLLSALKGNIGFSSGWLWVNVVDEDGTPYFFLREYSFATSTIYAIIGTSPNLLTNPTPIAATSPPLDSLYFGRSEYEELETGDGYVVVNQNPNYPPFSIELTQGTIHWVDADVLDLTFTSMGPGLAFRTPYGDDDVGYTSEHMFVEGTYNGKRVTGFGGHDRSYTEPAISWNQCSMFRNLEQGWIVWSGENEDGGMEYGWAVMGPNGWGVGGFCRDGEQPIVTDNLSRTVETTLGADGVTVLPASVTVTMEGRQFKFTSTGLLNFPNPELELKWVYGETVEVGGPALVKSHSMMELFKSSFFEE